MPSTNTIVHQYGINWYVKGKEISLFGPHSIEPAKARSGPLANLHRQILERVVASGDVWRISASIEFAAQLFYEGALTGDMLVRAPEEAGESITLTLPVGNKSVELVILHFALVPMEIYYTDRDIETGEQWFIRRQNGAQLSGTNAAILEILAPPIRRRTSEPSP